MQSESSAKSVRHEPRNRCKRVPRAPSQGSVAGAAFRTSDALLCSSMQPAVLDHNMMADGGMNLTTGPFFTCSILPPMGEAAGRLEKARRS